MIDPTTDPLNERAEAFLTSARRVAVPIPELARRLGADPDSLTRCLDEDPRFVVMDPVVLPDLSHLPSAADRDAYTRALVTAGVHVHPSVALAEPVSLPPGSPVDLLLRNSVARLLARSSDPALAAAAERLRSALTASVDPGETDPSTTPTPDPPARARVPPRRRAPSRGRPPYPGSRRG